MLSHLPERLAKDAASLNGSTGRMRILHGGFRRRQLSWQHHPVHRLRRGRRLQNARGLHIHQWHTQRTQRCWHHYRRLEGPERQTSNICDFLRSGTSQAVSTMQRDGGRAARSAGRPRCKKEIQSIPEYQEDVEGPLGPRKHTPARVPFGRLQTRADLACHGGIEVCLDKV